ncbi:glycosyltransferase [Streptomyces sp. NPDC059629]|uniref:glycosyltransferase n=1 Tax=Streptomyces sp. NPDC059629 TaxID=3346889 RepID=UPI0036B753F9
MTVVSPKAVVVVPTCNERGNLPVLAGLPADLPVPHLHRLGSPDTVGVLHRTAKDGLGRAHPAGMTRALDEGADVVIPMDADLSHPAPVIPGMVDTLLTTDAAVVLGSATRPAARPPPTARDTARPCPPGPPSGTPSRSRWWESPGVAGNAQSVLGRARPWS